MNKANLFLKVIVTTMIVMLGSLYLMEGEVYQSVNRIVEQLADPKQSISERLVLQWVTLYVALCGLVLPAPAELPLLFAHNVSLWKIILASALGKSIGSSLLFTFCSTSLRIGNFNVAGSRRSLVSGRLGRLLEGRKVGITFAIFQAIPFAPMRSATVGYSIFSPMSVNSILVVATFSFLGTVSRMLIVWGLATAGVVVLTEFAEITLSQ
jgi:hypothetical protein